MRAPARAYVCAYVRKIRKRDKTANWSNLSREREAILEPFSETFAIIVLSMNHLFRFYKDDEIWGTKRIRLLSDESMLLVFFSNKKMRNKIIKKIHRSDSNISKCLINGFPHFVIFFFLNNCRFFYRTSYI